MCVTYTVTPNVETFWDSVVINVMVRKSLFVSMPACSCMFWTLHLLQHSTLLYEDESVFSLNNGLLLSQLYDGFSVIIYCVCKNGLFIKFYGKPPNCVYSMDCRKSSISAIASSALFTAIMVKLSLPGN